MFGLSFLLHTCTLTTSQTYTQHTLLNCLVHCNMNGVFLLQSKLKPLYFSLSLVYVQMNRILSCHFDLKYCATWRCKASCVYMISRVFERVDNVVKLYCECVNNNDGLCFMIFFVDFFNTACIVEIKHYCTERVVFGGFLSHDIQSGWVLWIRSLCHVFAVQESMMGSCKLLNQMLSVL